MRAHLNLDSAGGWRVALLTQLGPGSPWLGNAYKGVPFPHASAMVADIFSILPSATNYEVMAANGVPGFDIDFYDGGYTYHTPLDDVSDYVPGTLSALGRNVRVIITKLGEQPEFDSDEPDSDKSATFYDYVNAGFIVYTNEAALIITCVLIVAGVTVFAAYVIVWARDDYVERRHVRHFYCFLARSRQLV